jgi:biotin transport system substrate-specific component
MRAQRENLRMTVYSSLFTALIIIGGYLSFPIPLSPVPIVLSDFFILLTGFFLGSLWGLSSVSLWIFLGALGLPVFAGGKAGLAVLYGPTGGYLAGFLFCVFFVGLIAGNGRPKIYKDIIALLTGNILIYFFGVLWLKILLKISLEKALYLGFFPFIPGIIIKSLVVFAVIKILRPKFINSLND